MTPIMPLDPQVLRRRCDPAAFTFETTTDLVSLAEIIGQLRAGAGHR